MYFIAEYIKRFCKKNEGNWSRHLFVAVIVYLLLIGSTYFITYLGVILNNNSILSLRYFYRVLNSPFVIIICVELFICILCILIDYFRKISVEKMWLKFLNKKLESIQNKILRVIMVCVRLFKRVHEKFYT